MRFLSSFAVLFLSAAASAFLTGCAGLVEHPPTTSPEIAVTPSSIDFKNVIVGQKNSQTIQISSTGTANLNITAVSLVGAGFSMGSLSTPLQLAPGTTKSLTLNFTPTSAKTSAGTVTIASDASNPILTVAIQGVGQQPAPAWQMIPSSFTFANTNVQTTVSENASIKNTGNVSVTISSVSVSGAAFSIAGLSTGLILSPSQQINFQVNFRPVASGPVAGTLKVSTPATSAPLTMALAGTGLTESTPAPQHHSVTLNWNPSPSIVAGYRIYRGTNSGGPYSLLNSSLVASTTYTDGSVISGDKYFYVTTAVSSVGDESVFSNEASATIPNP